MRKKKNKYEIGWYTTKPYHYKGKVGTLGIIISSDGTKEVLREERKEIIQKKIEETEKK